MTTNLIKRPLLTACVLFFLIIGMRSHCAAASASWTTDGSGNWNSNGNWSAAFPNAASEVATYNLSLTNPITVTLGEDITAGSIIFGSTLDQDVTIGAANTITLNNGGSAAAITVSGTTANTISSAISLSDDLTLTQGSSGTFTLSGGVSGTSKGLTKAGTGAFTLLGANTYTGATTVSAGTLTLTGSINSTSNVVVSTGGILSSAGSTVPNLSGSGSVVISANTINVSGASSTTFSGVISGAGNFQKTNTGTTTLSGINTYTGSTVLSFGTLNFSGSGSIATSSGISVPSGQGIAVNVNTSTTLPNLSGSITGGAVAIITVASGSTLTLNNSSDTSYGSVIAGAGNITKTGTGKLTLADTTTGDVNTYTGVTTVSAGTLTVAGSIATTASVTNNATLEFDTATGGRTFAKVISGTGALVKSNSNSLTLTAANTFTGAITINGGSIIQGIASGIPSTAAVTLADTSGVALTLGSFTTTLASLAGGGSNGGNVSLGAATLTVGDSNSTSYGGILSSTQGGLTKQGSGVLTLTGVNTYVGTTTINAGTLRFGGATIVPTTNVVVLADVASATLDLNDNSTTLGSISGGGSTGGNITLGSGTLTTGNSLDQTYAGVISETGGLTKAGSGTLTLSGTNTYTGATTISAGTLKVTGSIATTSAVANSGTLEFDTSSADATFAKVISGTGAVTKSGSNILDFTTVDQTYTGTTTISGGTLRLNRANQISSSSALRFSAASTTLDLNSNSQTFASMGGDSASISVVLGSALLTVGDSSSQLFIGVISGTGAFTKQGSGTLGLRGTQTYTGITTVSAGTLQLLSGSLNSSSSIAVSSGATLEYNTTLGDLTLTNVVSGAGGFTKSGTGTLTASSTNTFTGPLSITGGTLISSNSLAFLAASSTTVSGGATLTSSDGTTANYPVLSGTGSIVLLGSTGNISCQTTNGSSTFTGVVTGTSAGNAVTATGSSGNNRFTLIGDQSSYLGAFRASGGSILRIRGAFTNAALLSTSGSTSIIEVDTTDGSTSFGNLMSGAGTLRILGTNTFTLSGTQTFFTGNTEVTGGTFNLTGSILNSPTTTISSGARMKGTGTVNNLVCEGTMQPGGSIGTTVILGNYTQSSGSTLDIEFDTQGNVSLLDITGTATVASNTTLNLIPQGGRRYREDRVYTFLDADGGLTGTFTTETIANSNLHGATVSVTYTANQGRIVLTGSSDPLECDIAMLSITSNLAARTNQIQLGMVTEIQNQRLMETFYCPRNYTKQIEKEENDDPYEFYTRKEDKEYKAKRIEEKKRAFYHPYLLYDYSKDQMKAMAHQATAKDLYRSVGAGCDFYFLKEFILGGSLGYTGADGRSKNDCGKVSSDTYNLGLYFQSEVYEDIYIDGALQGAKSYYEIKRNDIDEGLKLSKPHGYEVASQLRFLAQKSIYALRIRPFMAWNYLLQQVSNYRERRDGFNILNVGKDHFSIVELALGSNFWAPFWFGRNLDWNLVPNLGFSFVQAIARNSHSVETAFITNLSAITRNPIRKTSRRYWVFEAGLSTYFRRCSEFFFTYKGTFDERYANVQEYRVGARASF